MSGTEEMIEREYADLLYLVDGTILDVSYDEMVEGDYKPYVRVMCDVENDGDFDECYDGLNLFFNSVERV